MGNKPIDWDAIAKKPEKDYKLSGTTILDFRKTIESQKEEINTKTSKIKAVEDEREKLRADLQAKADDLAKKIESLEKERDDKIKSLEQEMATKVETLEGKIKEQEDLSKELTEKLETATGSAGKKDASIEEKDTALAEKDGKINELESEMSNLQASVQQLESDKESLAAEKERLEQEIKSLEEQQDTLVNRVMELEDKFLKPARVVAEEDMETVRACNTCKQYVLALEDYKYIRVVKLFDATHRGHMLATLTYGDVKDDFTSKTEEYLEKIG